jgi:hypothetical protein
MNDPRVLCVVSTHFWMLISTCQFCCRYNIISASVGRNHTVVVTDDSLCIWWQQTWAIRDRFTKERFGILHFSFFYDWYDISIILLLHQIQLFCGKSFWAWINCGYICLTSQLVLYSTSRVCMLLLQPILRIYFNLFSSLVLTLLLFVVPDSLICCRNCGVASPLSCDWSN